MASFRKSKNDLSAEKICEIKEIFDIYPYEHGMVTQVAKDCGVAAKVVANIRHGHTGKYLPIGVDALTRQLAACEAMMQAEGIEGPEQLGALADVLRIKRDEAAPTKHEALMGEIYDTIKDGGPLDGGDLCGAMRRQADRGEVYEAINDLRERGVVYVKNGELHLAGDQ